MSQEGHSSEASHEPYCGTETAKASEKKEDLEADVAKHSAKPETPWTQRGMLEVVESDFSQKLLELSFAEEKLFAEDVKALADSTHVFQSETGRGGGTGMLAVPRECKCQFAHNDRSQRIRGGADVWTARQEGARDCARSARFAHLCNREVWCWRQ